MNPTNETNPMAATANRKPANGKQQQHFGTCEPVNK
jgi:hypothetical protein